MIATKEFKINEYITLKLEEGITNIYIKFQLFNQCKFLLLEIPVNEITELYDIESIDEATERLDNSLERNDQPAIEIPPVTEFWGHCSNIQVWAENNYDSRLLHRNLAFPLLKALADVGDPIAKHAFKEEIQKRLDSGYPSVVEFLKAERYTDYLDVEFRGVMIPAIEADALKDIEREIDSKFVFKQSIQIFKMTAKVNFYGKSNSAMFSTENNHVHTIALVDFNYCEGCEKEKAFLMDKANKADDPYFEYDFQTGKEDICLRCGIREYPIEIQLLPFLNTLIIILNDFFKNDIINPRIKNLTSLKELYLHGCGSDSIIEDISNLKNLTTLIINNYELRTIPSSIQRLDSLQILDLEQTSLKAFPETITNLKSLKALYLGLNSFPTLPDSITRLKNFKYYQLNNVLGM